MRACFLGSNICALGYGVAIVQTAPQNTSQDDRDAAPPAYPVVFPSDGQEYGRPAHFPLSHPLPRASKADLRRRPL
jgi:hypothetical protein